MTQTTATQTTATAQTWQGIAAENVDEVSARLSALLRRRARRLLTDLLRPHRREVAVAMLLIVISNLCALAGPWLVGVGIDRGIPPLAHGNAGPLALIVTAFFAVVGAQALTNRAYVIGIGTFGESVVRELRRRLFMHFQRLPVAFHETYTSGRVISRQTSDVDSISDLFSDGLDSLVSAVLSLVLVGVGMLLLDWPLALVVLTGFVPLTVLTVWFRRESAKAYRRIRETVAAVIVHFVETFGGIRAVQAFRRERRNEEIFSSLNADAASAVLRSGRLIAIYSPGITLVANVATGAVLLYGGFRVADGDIKVGVLATFLLYLQRFFDPLQDLSQFYNMFQSAGAALEKISGVLEEPPAVPEPAEPAALPSRGMIGRDTADRDTAVGPSVANGGAPGLDGAGEDGRGRPSAGPAGTGLASASPTATDPASASPAGTGPAGASLAGASLASIGTGPVGAGPAGTGPTGTCPAGTSPAGMGPAGADEAWFGREIRFDGVRFGYRENLVIPGLSLTIPPGQTVALLGETGAGKTTVARLASRFYDPREGRVLLDGIDLRDLSDATLRREVIVITQENFLFSGSVADNIALGKPEASRAEVEAAAAAIGAARFIEQLPGGFDAPVGKRGGRLSAGQRQLISFARAFLAAPSVLVLDEATSLLDIPSERAVQAALRTILAGRTAVIIAHRLSTVAIADRVLVMSAGEIVEDGPPELLLAGPGRYSDLHASWQSSLS